MQQFYKIKRVPNIYLSSGKDVQKSLRAIIYEHVKTIGVSKTILELVENFPLGSENLIVRILLGVTDRGFFLSFNSFILYNI